MAAADGKIKAVRNVESDEMVKANGKEAFCVNRNKPTVFLIPLVIVLIAVIAVGIYRYHQNQAKKALEATYQHALSIGDINNRAAPDFKLTDQNGKSVTLSSFRGKVVVLSFIDPECTDVCPILSAEIRQADGLLGPSADSNVEFVAVNVNQYHASTRDMLEYSKAHGLDKMANWHFVTGSTTALQAVWKNYGIKVVPAKTGDIEHSSFVFFINRSSHERYIAGATADKAAIDTWAHGIAFYVKEIA
jgi:cytochrome oxidase Cu insertion factor (SCO1/SenC/PrrC family)